MSLTKRWIDELMEDAIYGDETAQEALSSAGLWDFEEAERKKAEAEFYLQQIWNEFDSEDVD